VLVEGARDVAALRDLGFEGTILKLNSGEGLVERADHLSRAYGRIIILTDWDPKGLRLHERLKELLEDCQVEVEDRNWLRLRRLCGGGCRTIEDLPALIRSLGRMAGRAD
jgi:5S rRNA maturation endonuclease (ribonuclease M5)